MVRIAIIICVLLLCSAKAGAQDDCVASATLDRPLVYAREPVKVTITVLTPTWFTAPPEWSDLSLSNAFILPFNRTVSGLFDHHGKQFPGLQFYMIVFPYKQGKYIFPSVTITLHTPPVGSAIARTVTVKTAPLAFTVKPIDDDPAGNWLVARSVSIREQWNPALTNLKVGDLIQRTVTIDARGTLPQFIPSVAVSRLDFAAVYVQAAQRSDTRDTYDANGRMTQKITYLLEKQGDFELPPVIVTWLSPATNKVYSTKVPSGKIHVEANPHLGILTTIRDSLAGKQPGKLLLPERHPMLFLGLTWYQAGAILLILIIISWAALTLARHFKRQLKLKRAAWRTSEAYAFRQLMRSTLTLQPMIAQLYRWYDLFRRPGSAPDIFSAMGHTGQKGLRDETIKYFRLRYSVGITNFRVAAAFRTMIKAYRNEKKRKPDVRDEKISIWQTTLIDQKQKNRLFKKFYL